MVCFNVLCVDIYCCILLCILCIAYLVGLCEEDIIEPLSVSVTESSISQSPSRLIHTDSSSSLIRDIYPSLHSPAALKPQPANSYAAMAAKSAPSRHKLVSTSNKARGVTSLQQVMWDSYYIYSYL